MASLPIQPPLQKKKAMPGKERLDKKGITRTKKDNMQSFSKGAGKHLLESRGICR